ncbi:MAG: hypothetical protein D6736_02600 [Nitrospinota bacterium]|nr:MAG: hypothetical protein D6736_02600 [Nitrospinota bacterium]
MGGKKASPGYYVSGIPQEANSYTAWPGNWRFIGLVPKKPPVSLPLRRRLITVAGVGHSNAGMTPAAACVLFQS